MVQRRTKQREAILEILQRRNYHPTADQVYDEVKKTVPSISLGTVYRNLDALLESGMIARIEGTSPARYEGVQEPHLHLKCCRCGEIYDIWPTRPVVDLSSIPDDCQVTEWELLLQGLCPNCLSKEKEASSEAQTASA